MADDKEEAEVVSEDKASWYNSDFDTGRLTDDQLNETTTRVVRVVEPIRQEDPLVFELNTVIGYYEEGPHDEELPAFDGMNEYQPYQKEEYFDTYMNEPIFLGPTVYYYCDFPFFVNPLPKPPFLPSGSWTRWMEIDTRL
jgi:hypothetical protein